MFKLRGIPLLLVLVAGLAIPGSALAAPPSNDDFAAAEELSGRTATVSGLNKDATKEVGEPDHAGNAGGASVWYRWTAPASGPATLSTCGSDFDTLLAAYTGDSVDNLAEVQSNDDSCSTRSSMSFAAEEGVTYRIAVDGTNSVTGGFTLDLRLSPHNDDFIDAVALAGDAGSVDGTNVGASSEAGEPEYLGNSVWYRWTAPSSGWATFETCGSGFDTVLTVFTGSQLAGLQEIAWSDDGCGYSSRASFEATAGVIYSIALSGFAGAEGEFQLAWNRNAPPPEPPEPPYAVDYPTIAGVIAGVPREGQTLTASEGEWFGAPPISFAYAWVRCEANFGSCNAIAGAISRTYTLTGADVGYRLYVRVTASNVAGSSWETSAATQLVRPSGPTNTAAPQLSGEARVGEALFAYAGNWTGLQPIHYTYQWQECDAAGNACLDLQGENGSVIEVRAQHVDSRLRVVVTASNADGPRSAVSDLSSVVAPPRQQPRRCVVPRVRGKQLAAARKAITKAYCRVGRVQRKFSNRVRAGRVISQTPRPRARLASRGRVHLVVSKGRRR
jgi:PASTA domain